MKHRRSFSLKNALAMQFIIVAIAPTLIATLFLFFLIIPQIREESLAIAQIPSRLENRLDEEVGLLLGLSAQLKKQPSTPDTRVRPEKNGSFNAIYLLDKSGEITPVLLPHEDIGENKTLKATDAAVARIFLPENHAGPAIWSDAFFSPVTHGMTAACVVPLGNHALVGEISSMRLAEMLKKQNLSSTILILDKNGHIVASGNDALNQGNPFPAASVQMEKPGFYRLGTHSIPGTLTTLRNTPWSVLIALPDVSLTQNMLAYAPLLFLCFVVGLVLALLFSFYSSRSINRRIGNYIEKTRAIAQGSSPSIVSDDPIREIAHFSQSLGKMHLTLQERENGYNKAMTHYLEIMKGIESMVVTVDPNGVITHVNDTASHLFGLEPEKCTRRPFMDFVSPDRAAVIKERHTRWAELDMASVTIEDEVIDHHGKAHSVLWHITPNHDENGRLTGFTGIGHAFSAGKAAQEECQLAKMLYQKSAEAMLVMDEKNRIISVNPAFEKITGYTAAEALTRDLSMLGSASHGKLFYENMENALQTADNWQGEAWHRCKNGDPYAIRLSINTVRTPGKTSFRRIALFSDITGQKLAEQATKPEEKNTLLYFTGFMRETAQARIQLIHDLRQALADRQFEIRYQPVVEIQSGLISKAEAAIRWQHPTRGALDPAEFLTFSEDPGMITDFGNWIFHEAASQASQWRKHFHPDFQISIPLSPLLFKSNGIDLVDWISHLRECSLPGSGLLIEITEGLLREKSDHVRQQLAALKNTGMEIALDDLGVGYASLSYLQDIPFDYIRINPSFIRNLSQSADNQALCEAIIVMAHQRRLKVIAEGIETIRQREILADALCDFGQGDIYSSPLLPAGFEQMLENHYARLDPGLGADIA